MAATLNLLDGMTGTILPYAFSTPPANGGWLLLDVPEQPGFPETIDWPVLPE